MDRGVEEVDPFEIISGVPNGCIGVTYLDYHIWGWSGWTGSYLNDGFYSQWLAHRIGWKKTPDHKWNFLYQDCSFIGNGKTVIRTTSKTDQEKAKDLGFEAMLKLIEDYSARLTISVN